MDIEEAIMIIHFNRIQGEVPYPDHLCWNVSWVNYSKQPLSITSEGKLMTSERSLLILNGEEDEDVEKVEMNQYLCMALSKAGKLYCMDLYDQNTKAANC